MCNIGRLDLRKGSQQGGQPADNRINRLEPYYLRACFHSLLDGYAIVLCSDQMT